MTTLSVPEAATLLKVHPKTVEGLISANAFPAAKIGRAWVMLEKDVLKYLEQEIIKQTCQRMGLPNKEQKS